MSTFTTPCKVELIGPNKFRLIETFEYHIEEYPNSNPLYIIKVPVGFKTDFASVPRIFWPIVSPIDEYAKGAVIHDYLYYHGYFDRKTTDDIFNEAMKVLEVPKWKRLLVYYCVRYFSRWAWNKCRKNHGSNRI